MIKLLTNNKRSKMGILFLLLICSFMLVCPMQSNLGEQSQEIGSNSFVKETGDYWFDLKWAYCQRIEITNPSDFLTNYQVKLVLNPSNFDYAKANPLGNDLRFTYLDNVTILNYWIEEWNNIATSTIWVNIPLLETSSTRTILLYYGNNNAASFSNGSLTFDAFDDFSGSELNEEIWDVTAYEDGIQSYDLINGELNVNISVSGFGNDSGYYYALKQNLTQENYVITCKSRWENLDHYRGFGIFNGIYLLDDTDHSYFQTVALWGDDHVGIYRNVETTAEHINVADLTEGNAYTEYKVLGNNYNFSLSGSYNYDYIFSNSNFDDPFRVFIETRIGGRDESPVSLQAYYDFFHIRNYTASEPEVTINSTVFDQLSDTYPPEITLVSPEEYGHYNKSEIITVNITDSNDIVDVKFNWDSDANTTTTLSIDGLFNTTLPTAPGTHILRVYATDESDNVGFNLFAFFTNEDPSITEPIGYSFVIITVSSIGAIFIGYKIIRKRK